MRLDWNIFNRVKAFDTITTKLLTLILFITVIPLMAIANLSANLVQETVQEQIILEKKLELTTQKPQADSASLIEKQNSKTMINYINIIAILSVISLFVAIGIAIFFSRTIIKPILELANAANNIASGNLNYRLKPKGNDEISKLSRTFNLMAKNLQEQEQLRNNFVATLTHDLKVPMLAENKTIQYMLDESYGPINGEQKEVLNLIKDTNNSSLEMVGTLLEVYRYESGNSKLMLCQTDICSLVQSSVDQISSLAKDKNISIKMQTPQECINIEADEREIKRVMHNLLGNAINNGKADGEINCKIEFFDQNSFYNPDSSSYESTTLQSEQNLSQCVLVTVEDNGTGIKKEDMPDLFKRFSLSKGRKPAGTGLGLYYCSKVIDEHKGAFWAESTENLGSAFKFILPLKQETINE